jgi:hypothetical protein
MRSHIRTLGSLLATAGLTAALSTSLSAPAHAMPERFADAGTIVSCDGEGGTLTAIDTTMAGTTWSAGMLVGDSFASAGGETPLFDGHGLHGTFPAYDDPGGAVIGDLTIDGTITRGETEILSGWDVDEDGRRNRTEGTRTPLTGEVTLTLGEAATTLRCVGWEFDTETFRLTKAPATTVDTAWWTDSYELPGGAGTIGFYGVQQHELGIALDLFHPSYLFAGERLQISNGHVDGSLLLRDPDTGAVVGMAKVGGTVTETGRERTTESGPGYQRVTDLVHYDVSLTISTQHGEWSGTWGATHETSRVRSVIPPKAL